jgi:hypothetical protein
MRPELEQARAVYRQLLAVNAEARRPGRTPELLHQLIDLALAWASFPAPVRALIEGR